MVIDLDHPLIQRIGVLRVKQRTGKITDQEQREMEACLDALVGRLYKRALLKNYSLLASITNDLDWQHDICGEIDNTN